MNILSIPVVSYRMSTLVFLLLRPKAGQSVSLFVDLQLAGVGPHQVLHQHAADGVTICGYARLDGRTSSSGHHAAWPAAMGCVIADGHAVSAPSTTVSHMVTRPSHASFARPPCSPLSSSHAWPCRLPSKVPRLLALASPLHHQKRRGGRWMPRAPVCATTEFAPPSRLSRPQLVARPSVNMLPAGTGETKST